jgi:hypothetical protein
MSWVVAAPVPHWKLLTVAWAVQPNEFEILQPLEIVFVDRSGASGKSLERFVAQRYRHFDLSANMRLVLAPNFIGRS